MIRIIRLDQEEIEIPDDISDVDLMNGLRGHIWVPRLGLKMDNWEQYRAWRKNHKGHKVHKSRKNRST